MNLRIITKEREILGTEVDHVILPGTAGEMDILAGHAQLMSLLQGGDIKYFSAGKESLINIKSGCVEVANDKILALVDIG